MSNKRKTGRQPKVKEPVRIRYKPLTVKKGFGIHNGRLHRSLGQIQVELFEEESGLDNIVSTSSIMEGINISAENVII